MSGMWWSGVRRLDRGLAVVERAAVVGLLCSLLGLGLLQVIWRNLFSSGWVWADEVLRHLVLWLGLWGASLATRDQRHLRIDALTHWLPARFQPWLMGVTHLLAAATCVALAVAGWRLVQYEMEGGAVLRVGLPVWVAQGMMPLVFGLMALRFAGRSFAAWTQGREARP